MEVDVESLRNTIAGVKGNNRLSSLNETNVESKNPFEAKESKSEIENVKSEIDEIKRKIQEYEQQKEKYTHQLQNFSTNSQMYQNKTKGKLICLK